MKVKVKKPENENDMTENAALWEQTEANERNERKSPAIIMHRAIIAGAPKPSYPRRRAAIERPSMEKSGPGMPDTYITRLIDTAERAMEAVKKFFSASPREVSLGITGETSTAATIDGNHDHEPAPAGWIIGMPLQGSANDEKRADAKETLPRGQKMPRSSASRGRNAARTRAI
jgi:hypothetical protein